MSDRNEIERKAIGHPLAVENAAMRQSATISEFGELAAKKREVAIETAKDLESGDVAEQEAYLHWEARVDEEERNERAERADTHDASNDQTRSP